MALTITPHAGFGTQYSIEAMLARGMGFEIGRIAFDSSYPTGGETFSIDLKEVVDVFIPQWGGYLFEYDRTNTKIKVKVETGTSASALSECASGTDLSALTSVPYLAFGYND